MHTMELILNIQKCLSPDLLKKEYRAENATNPMFGHCYVASEVLYHMLGPDKYSAACGRDERGIVHWWIVDKVTGEVHDATADQYLSKSLIPPYAKGRRTGFLTKGPSKRAQIVLARMSKL